MGLYQPTVITPSQLNGTGVIDATQDLTVTWQINGTDPIKEWQFIIMRNDADSTVLYTSEWRHGKETEYVIPETGQVIILIWDTYGRTVDGTLTPTTDIISAADLANAGVVNNYEYGYKLRINQRYYKYTTPTHFDTVVLVQNSPAFFQAVDTLVLDTETWSNPKGRYAYFQYTYTNYAASTTYDPVITMRQTLSLASNPEENVIDERIVYLPAVGDWRGGIDTEMVYGILDNGQRYAFKMDAYLESGRHISSGWHTFISSYNDTALDYVHLNVYYVRDTPAVFVRMEVDEGYDESIVSNLPDYQRWTIYRVRKDTGEKEKVGIIPKGQNAIYDFGLKNNTEYYYRAYYGLREYDGYMYESRTIKMQQYWNWAIIECEKVDGFGFYAAQHAYLNPMYHVKRVHQFQANVDSGAISNENQPYVENNFTPYPTVQKVGRKGLSGKLRAWVGGVKDTTFRDSVQMVNDLMDLSTRNTVKFLRDRKGNLRMIEISDAIVKETQDKYAEQPVQIEIPWVEIGDAKDCQIVSLLTDGVMAKGDDIIDTVTAISPDQDGYVTWTRNSEGYVGSEIQMNENGQLEQVYDNNMDYVPANLEIDSEGKLKVETVIKADD